MDEEAVRNWQLVRAPTGIPWSGRARYAAATYLYHQGDMSDEVLEVYRICSRLDGQDPLAVLRLWQIGSEWLERMNTLQTDPAA